jgi:hypothetical protein
MKMDVYLPADFYRLREDLRDWRDASSVDLEKPRTFEKVSAEFNADSRNACADPLWRVF